MFETKLKLLIVSDMSAIKKDTISFLWDNLKTHISADPSIYNIVGYFTAKHNTGI